ncbi:MAG: hypothetical protein K5682_02360 [Lachnospiraceae bacterium]|nr:hypothetical protein [Lachnospiraceae bacterium]
MRSLLEFREYLRVFYSKYDVYIKPAGKFLLAFVVLQVINARLGYMSRIDSVSMVLIAALMCSFMPRNFVVICATAFILLHLYALSIECAIVGLLLFFIMFLLFFRFASKDTVVVAILPVLFVMKIPYVIPVAMGLLATPVSAVSVGCGVAVYYFLHFITENEPALTAMGEDDMMTRFRFIVDGLLANKGMLVLIIAFAITIAVVYIVRRLAINYAWTIAMIAGVLVQLVVLLFGDLVAETGVSIAGVILGSVLALAVGKVLEFFFFNLDYPRTEKVQFEDDEYYYYVKAVPKVTVTTPEKRVKKISSKQ